MSDVLWLINKKAVRELMLDLSKEKRAGKFKRVSEKALLDVNRAVFNRCEHAVMSHPSMGKTIMSAI